MGSSMPGMRVEIGHRIELGAFGRGELPLVAGNDVHFLQAADHRMHLALRAIGENTTLQQVEEGRALPR